MIASAILLAAAAADPIAGTWEGTSLCQVKPSPCHDEHVVYRVSLERRRHYKLDAYKVIATQEVFMGSIAVTLDHQGTQLDGRVVSGGRSRAQLHLDRIGAHLSGRMTLSDGTFYRLIETTNTSFCFPPQSDIGETSAFDPKRTSLAALRRSRGYLETRCNTRRRRSFHPCEILRSARRTCRLSNEVRRTPWCPPHLASPTPLCGNARERS